MKSSVSLIMLAVILCATAPAASAADFQLVAVYLGNNTSSYTLKNYSQSIDVFQWTLHWNPTDWVDDLAQGEANFDPASGVIQPLPSLWFQVSGSFPWFATYTSQGAVKRNGGTLGGFTVKYGTTANPNPVLPLWFTVSYYDGPTLKTSAMMPVSEQVIPEPSSLLALTAGLGVIARRIRRWK